MSLRFLLTAIAASAFMLSASIAQAAGGCGEGYHRGPYGGCVRNPGPVCAPGWHRNTHGVCIPN